MALYVELARSRYRCEGALVVLTVAPGVRDWIERDIAKATGRYAFARQLTPVVIALDRIEPSLHLRPDRPYLAPLAVAVHAKTPAAREVAKAAMDITMERLPRHVATEQLNAILGMVDDALRAHLKSRIKRGRRLRSSYLQGLVAAYQARSEAEREARGWAEAILLVLDARGIKVSPAIKKRILACTDVAVLEQWVRRAAVASTAAAVVEPEAPPQAASKRPVRKTRKAA
jgi:hypothetical protein